VDIVIFFVGAWKEAAEFAPGPTRGDLDIDDGTCPSGDERSEGGEEVLEMFSDGEEVLRRSS
jgi:hypothetical protein